MRFPVRGLLVLLGLASASCGYAIRPSGPVGRRIRVGSVSVRDPDPALAVEARAILARALAESNLPSALLGRVLDVEVSTLLDDAPSSVLTVTPGGAEGTDTHSVVQLRARWSAPEDAREILVTGHAEAPVGTDARSVGEAGSLARRMALEDAAQRLVDALSHAP